MKIDEDLRDWLPIIASFVSGFLVFLWVWGWWAAIGATVVSVVWGYLSSREPR